MKRYNERRAACGGGGVVSPSWVSHRCLSAPWRVTGRGGSVGVARRPKQLADRQNCARKLRAVLETDICFGTGPSEQGNTVLSSFEVQLKCLMPRGFTLGLPTKKNACFSVDLGACLVCRGSGSHGLPDVVVAVILLRRANHRAVKTNPNLLIYNEKLQKIGPN